MQEVGVDRRHEFSVTQALDGDDAKDEGGRSGDDYYQIDVIEEKARRVFRVLVMLQEFMTVGRGALVGELRQFLNKMIRPE